MTKDGDNEKKPPPTTTKEEETHEITRESLMALLFKDDDDLAKEREKEARLANASVSSLPNVPRVEPNRCATGKMALSLGTDALMKYDQQQGHASKSESVDHSNTTDDEEDTTHHRTKPQSTLAPQAPMERTKETPKKQQSELDLMKIVAKRSALAGMDDSANDSSSRVVETDHPKTFHDSSRRLPDEQYYAAPEDELRRSNIKPSPASSTLSNKPGAYAGAPGVLPRRVRSVRYNTLGVSLTRAEQEQQDTAYADYLDREGRKLADLSEKSAALEGSNHNHNTTSIRQRESQETQKNGIPRTASTMGLVEARMVGDESQQLDMVVEADAYEGPTELEKQTLYRRKRYKYLLVIGCLAVMLVLMIVLILWKSGVVFDQETAAASFTLAPSFSPTTAPSEAPTDFVVTLPDFTITAIQNYPDSPQAKAYRWLQQDPRAFEYSEEKNQQRFALVVLYYALHGSTASSNWTLETNWLSYSVDECQWFSKGMINMGDAAAGVCDEEARYQSIIMTDNELTGSLVPELALLSQLKILDLATNQVGGRLPTELGLLTHLQEIALDANSLTGPLPTELGLLRELEVLFVHTNSITGTIPTELGLLINMVDFEAGGCKLNGTVPSELGLMTGLTALTLHDNDLTGTIPMQLWNLTDLSDLLQLNGNAFTGTLATELGRLTSLKRMRIFSTRLGGSVPSELGQMTSLNYLDLCCSSFEGPIPSEIGRLTSLATLYLYSSKLSGRIPTEIGAATQIRRLSLHQNRCNGTLPTELGNLRQLEILSLQNNTLTGPIPSELGLLDSITYMNAEINSLSSTIPTELFTLPSIEKLLLGKNGYLRGTIPTELGLLNRTLTKFSLDWTPTSGTLPTELGVLTNLQGISVSTTLLGGPLISELGLLTSLEILFVEDNDYITGTIPTELENLARLKILTLNKTGLSGTIPPRLCGVSTLQFDCSERLCGCKCACDN